MPRKDKKKGITVNWEGKRARSPRKNEGEERPMGDHENTKLEDALKRITDTQDTIIELLKAQIGKPNVQSNNGEGGSHSGGDGPLQEYINVRSNDPLHEHVNTRNSPFSQLTMPPFLDDSSREQDCPSPIAETVTAWMKEYDMFPPNVKSTLSLNDFYYMRSKQKRKASTYGGHQSNVDLQKVVGKVTLPYFDGSSKCLARSWVQKLDTYFQLNPMQEKDAIK